MGEQVMYWDGEPEQQLKTCSHRVTQGWTQPGQPRRCDQMALLPQDQGQCWKKAHQHENS